MLSARTRLIGRLPLVGERVLVSQSCALSPPLLPSFLPLFFFRQYPNHSTHGSWLRSDAPNEGFYRRASPAVTPASAPAAVRAAPPSDAPTASPHAAQAVAAAVAHVFTPITARAQVGRSAHPILFFLLEEQSEQLYPSRPIFQTRYDTGRTHLSSICLSRRRP